MIIDAHTHAWPDAIAERALGAPSPAIKRQGDGKTASLVKALEAGGVDRAVCLGIANTAKHLEATNKFAATLDARLIGFGSLHAGRDVETNLHSLRENGLRGTKLNPPFQGFGGNAARLLKLATP